MYAFNPTCIRKNYVLLLNKRLDIYSQQTALYLDICDVSL